MRQQEHSHWQAEQEQRWTGYNGGQEASPGLRNRPHEHYAGLGLEH